MVSAPFDHLAEQKHMFSRVTAVVYSIRQMQNSIRRIDEAYLEVPIADNSTLRGINSIEGIKKSTVIT
jgi:hypothetical protein